VTKFFVSWDDTTNKLPAVVEAALADDFVGLDGDQNVNGTKNFTTTPYVNGVAVALVSSPPSIPPAWSASQVGPGVVGEYYTFQYVATGSPAPAYAVTLGSLPPGLTLTSAGLLSGTPLTVGTFTFTVTASNDVDPDITRERTIDITAAPVAVGGGLVYGAGMGYDGKGNQIINGGSTSGSGRTAIKFRASTSSALHGVRFTQRSGPGGYSGGTGGVMTIQVRPDDGTGKPHATTVLATMSFNPVAYTASTEIYDLKVFPTPANLVAGTIYHIVFSNPSTTNFISVNNIYCYETANPRHPRYADSDFAIMESPYSSWSWSLADWYTPVVDLVYSNGVIDGQCYYESMNPQSQNITGTNYRVRENILVSGGNKIVTGVYVRARRASGSTPLVLTLKDSSGATMQSVSVPSTAIATTSAGGVDAAGAVWVGGVFAAPATLISGNRYYLELSTTTGTYSTWPIRAKGNPESYQSFCFSEGLFEFATTGTNWDRGYYDPYQVNVQMYFTLA
jgi:hypothetical protein